MKELTGLFRLQTGTRRYYKKTNRFAAIIRIACDILMFVLEIVYEFFFEKVKLGINKSDDLQGVIFDRAKNGSKYCVKKQQLQRSPPLVIKRPETCLITFSFYFIKIRGASAAEERQRNSNLFSHMTYNGQYPPNFYDIY